MNNYRWYPQLTTDLRNQRFPKNPCPNGPHRRLAYTAAAARPHAPAVDLQLAGDSLPWLRSAAASLGVMQRRCDNILQEPFPFLGCFWKDVTW